jgi:hypothetical protein
VGTLSPGTWEIAAAPPPNLFVARLDETRLGAEGYEIQFSAGEVRELTIAFSRYPAVLKGKVLAGPEQPAIGAPVYVVPLDPELRSRSGGVRSLRADAKGEFQAGGLAPGRYEVISSYTLGEIDDGVRPVGEGITVTLGEGVEETIEIRIKDS